MISNLFSIKYAALALLVLQNTFLVVFMRYSRTSEGPMYASSTAVAMMEVVKFVTCLCVIAYQKRGIKETAKCLYEVLLLFFFSFLLTFLNMDSKQLEWLMLLNVPRRLFASRQR